MQITKTEHGLYSVDVEGRTYEFEKWGAEQAFDVLFDIVCVVGEPLAVAAQTANGGGELTSELTSQIAGMLTSKLAANKALCFSVIKRLTSGAKVQCDGKSVTFDSHYQDNLPHCFEVLQAAVEVQYGNFLGSLLSAVGGLKVAKAKPPKSAATK